MQFAGVAVDEVRAGSEKLVLPVAPRLEADAQHRSPSGGKKVPHGIAHDVAVGDANAHALLAREEQVRFRLGAQHVSAIDDDHRGRDAERLEGGIDLRPAARRCDPVGHTVLAQPAEEFDGTRQGSPLREQLAEKCTVAALDALRLVVGQRPARLARDGSGEQSAAHPDATMDAPSLDRKTGFGERLLPREDVRVDRVDEGPVEVEDQRLHPRPAFRCPLLPWVHPPASIEIQGLAAGQAHSDRRTCSVPEDEADVAVDGAVLAVITLRPADPAVNLLIRGRSVLDQTIAALRAASWIGPIVLALEEISQAEAVAAIFDPGALRVQAAEPSADRWR